MTTTPTLWKAAQQANSSDLGPGGNDQLDSKIVQLSNGNFVVLWTDNSDGGPGGANGTDIIGQIYDPLGNKIGGEFRANQDFFADDEDEFDVAALPNGGFVVAFEDTNASGTSIRVTEWNAGATSSTTRTIKNDPGADDLGNPTVTVNADGSYFVAYQQTGVGGATVFGKFVSSAGVVGAEVTLISGSDNLGVDGQQIDSAKLVDGTTVVVSRYNTADDAIAVRLVDAAGNSSGVASFVANTNANGDTDLTPAVAALTGGGFIVAWANTDANDTDIEFQRYNAAGVAQGGVVTVRSGGATDDNRAPAIVGLDDGGFFIVWDDSETNTIKGQRYSATGGLIGAELTIATGAFTPILSSPALELLEDGRISVSWTTTALSFPDFDSDVRFAIYDPRENSVIYSSESEAITTRVGEDTTIDAGSGSDTIFGQDGNDLLQGGLNGDTIFGGSGNDTIYAMTEDDPAGSGVGDSILGDAGNDSIIGSNGGDTANGGGGADTLDGGDGDDRLIGGGAADIITGGTGRDTMTGSAGADDFVFNDVGESPANATRDVITDFVHLTDDIDLSEIDAQTTPNGDQTFVFIGDDPFTAEGQIRAIQSGGGAGPHTIIQVNTTGNNGAEMVIQLSNFNAATLTAADFIL
jgi:Ca2+-binding RTX toxin-like protein